MGRFLFRILCLILLYGCNTVEEKYPEFAVVDTLQTIKNYGSPALFVTIKNTGKVEGFNVSCEIIAKSNNSILDAAIAYFKGGEPIFPGEKSTDEAVFLNLNSHSDYIAIEYKLKWNTPG